MSYICWSTTGVPLTDDSFDALSLIRIRRPLWIRLFENKLTTLHESVFAPFLELNQYNMIDLSGNNIQCDCRIKWIINEKGYYSTGKIAGTNISSCQLNNCWMDNKFNNFDNRFD